MRTCFISARANNHHGEVNEVSHCVEHKSLPKSPPSYDSPSPLGSFFFFPKAWRWRVMQFEWRIDGMPASKPTRERKIRLSVANFLHLESAWCSKQTPKRNSDPASWRNEKRLKESREKKSHWKPVSRIRWLALPGDDSYIFAATTTPVSIENNPELHGVLGQFLERVSMTFYSASFHLEYQWIILDGMRCCCRNEHAFDVMANNRADFKVQQKAPSVAERKLKK